MLSPFVIISVSSYVGLVPLVGLLLCFMLPYELIVMYDLVCPCLLFVVICKGIFTDPECICRKVEDEMDKKCNI